MASYRALDPGKIIATLEKLERRIRARFPQSGLAKLCGEIMETARMAAGKAELIARPDLRFRWLEGALIVAGLLLLGVIGANIDYRRNAENIYSVLQGIDSGFNIIVLVGAAVLFITRFEQMAKRAQALKQLHELRSLIHIVDMHQLTKDPSVVTQPGPATAASPENLLTPFELSRYLDYCSEMLSLTAKVAALYAQSSGDSVVIATVNDLEQLAANLSEKIWQKIGLLQRETAAVPILAKPTAVQG